MPPPPRVLASFVSSVRLPARAHRGDDRAFGRDRAGADLGLLRHGRRDDAVASVRAAGAEPGHATGVAVPRSRAWIGACAILLFAVLLAASVGWLSFLALGTDAPRVGELGGLALAPLESGRAAVAGQQPGVLVFVLPFLYAPMILIESRARFSGAVLESARLVARGGVLPHAALSIVANALQTAPVWIAGLCAALLAEDELFPLWTLFALPLLSLSIPLGQGMLVSAYAERRAELEARRDGKTQRGGHSRALLALWAVLVAAPRTVVRHARRVAGAAIAHRRRIAAARRGDWSRAAREPSEQTVIPKAPRSRSRAAPAG